MKQTKRETSKKRVRETVRGRQTYTERLREINRLRESHKDLQIDSKKEERD